MKVGWLAIDEKAGFLQVFNKNRNGILDLADFPDLGLN